jgi:23S rRNA-/tRNA-specific pseudouridylate synthase
VLHEDEHLAVGLKPYSVKIHEGDSRRTVTGALAAGALNPSTSPDALNRLEPVRWLDAAVGWLLVVTKTRSA